MRKNVFLKFIITWITPFCFTFLLIYICLKEIRELSEENKILVEQLKIKPKTITIIPKRNDIPSQNIASIIQSQNTASTKQNHNPGIIYQHIPISTQPIQTVRDYSKFKIDIYKSSIENDSVYLLKGDDFIRTTKFNNLKFDLIFNHSTYEIIRANLKGDIEQHTIYPKQREKDIDLTNSFKLVLDSSNVDNNRIFIKLSMNNNALLAGKFEANFSGLINHDSINGFINLKPSFAEKPLRKEIVLKIE